MQTSEVFILSVLLPAAYIIDIVVSSWCKSCCDKISDRTQPSASVLMRPASRSRVACLTVGRVTVQFAVQRVRKAFVKKMDFYYHPASPYCRSVMLVAKALKLNLNMLYINIMKDEQLRPSFTALNPFHCVPTLVDNDLTLWESRAILVYLVDKYGRTNSRLYPKDAQTRALINQRLFFDHGTLSTRLEDYYYPLYFEGAPAGGEKLEKLEEALTLLNGFLTTNPYAAGPNMTLADYSLVATISSLEVVQYDLSKYPAIAAWYEACKATIVDYQEINEAGLQQYREYFESGLNPVAY